MKLGVNIDHIATLRNARGQNNPNLLRALKVCQDAKIDVILNNAPGWFLITISILELNSD